jgi:hypothetical protein
MPRFRHAVVAVAAAGLVCAPGAFADEPNPVGFPKDAPRGGVGVYRVWYADGAWHLRSSTEDSGGKKDKLMVFSGTVRCDGKLTVEPNRLETGGGKTGDRITPAGDGKSFSFEFKTYGAIDEAVFKAADKAKTLTFDLKIDGQPAPLYRVVVGAAGGSPEKNPFKLPAHPKK